MTMMRRSLLAATASAVLAGLHPEGGRAADTTPDGGLQSSRRMLRFSPRDPLVSLDPHRSSADSTRTHAFAVFDTLYGMDARFRPSPQMVEGAVIGEGGHRWKIALRQGLRWHDGERVLARDCVASLQRWGRLDPFGRALMQATDELSATDDRTIQFRLRRAFPALPSALAKCSGQIPAMMPEWLARTEIGTDISQSVGSGPFRFVPDAFQAGRTALYRRFAGYVPRSDGRPEWTAGPKSVQFDAVEWQTLDPEEAKSRLLAASLDWWEAVPAEQLESMQTRKGLHVSVLDPLGRISLLRLDQSRPPFDRPSERRVVLGAVSQTRFMQALTSQGEGTQIPEQSARPPEPASWREPIGVFTPGTPLANKAGLQAIADPRDTSGAALAMRQAGYRGEPTSISYDANAAGLLAPSRLLLGELGIKDAGSDRRHVETTARGRTGRMQLLDVSGLRLLLPLGNPALSGWGGFDDGTGMDQSLQDWLQAIEIPAQLDAARRMQDESLKQALVVPLGQHFPAAAWQADLVGVQPGFPVFWSVGRS